MHPLIIFAIGVGVYNSISNWLNESKELQGISSDNIADESITVYQKSNLRTVKNHITRKIGTYMPQCNFFKIGKSGSVYSRACQHKDYQFMILLAKSKRKHIIDELESHYIDKYYEHEQCDNLNHGSAGSMTDSDGNYYLYMILR